MSGNRLDVSTRVKNLALFLSRQDAKWTKLHLKHLHSQNLRSEAPITGLGGPVVSITSYGPRLDTAYLALESIAAGTILPSRLILWTEDDRVVSDPAPPLRRLVKRGLEIRLTLNYGPHTKYYPYLLSADKFDAPLVTADDDVLYSRWWLAGLLNAHAHDSRVVSCCRAHIVKIASGVLQPYGTWTACESDEPSFRHFATGVSGCIYPVEFLSSLKVAGSEFLRLCPTADDIWLHVNALRAGFKIRQIRQRPSNFAFVPGTQSDGLAKHNVGLSYNDEQIRKTYTEQDIALLTSAGL